jgi:hypothetical protein
MSDLSSIVMMKSLILSSGCVRTIVWNRIGMSELLRRNVRLGLVGWLRRLDSSLCGMIGKVQFKIAKRVASCFLHVVLGC